MALSFFQFLRKLCGGYGISSSARRSSGPASLRNGINRIPVEGAAVDVGRRTGVLSHVAGLGGRKIGFHQIVLPVGLYRGMHQVSMNGGEIGFVRENQFGIAPERRRKQVVCGPSTLRYSTP
jgi:hypothetical protein